MKGSNVYLTGKEKQSILTAIAEYIGNVESAEDKEYINYYIEHDEKALHNTYQKLTGREKTNDKKGRRIVEE